MSVLIVDDVCLYREGLAAMLAREPGFQQVATASDVQSARAILSAQEPDVALLNVADGDHGLVHAIREIDPAVAIIVIGVSEREDDVLACAEAGVAGYLLRTEPLEHLIRVMRSVAAGESLCSPRIAALLLRRVRALSAQHRVSPPGPALTARELDVLHLLDLGLSNQGISERLGITVRTVKNHVHNILEKTGARRRGEAVAALREPRGPARSTASRSATAR